MISNSFKAASVNSPSFSFQKGLIIKKAIEFIEETIIGFQEEYINADKDSEEKISEYLVQYLIYKANIDGVVFIFTREAIQKQKKGNDRRADIGVLRLPFDRSPFFIIEAKRLPTPGAKRKKEYVIGGVEREHSGGIERFKLGLHGSEHEKSAIIAYVEKEEFKFWVDEINSWIDELISLGPQHNICWTQEDKLVDEIELAPKKISKFRGSHSRTNSNNIDILHYLMAINAK